MNLFIKNITLILILIIPLFFISQEQLWTSKKKVSNKYRTIISKENHDFEELKERIFSLTYTDPNVAITLCLKTLENFLPKGPSETTVFCYSSLGSLYSKKSLPVLALSYYMDAIHEGHLMEETWHLNPKLKEKPWLILNLGNIYFNEGKYYKALEKFIQAEENFILFDANVEKVRGLSTCYNNMALYHIKFGEFNKALEFLMKTLKLRIESNYNEADISHSYKSLCELYFLWDMPKKAKTYKFKTDSIKKYLFQNRHGPKFNKYPDMFFNLSSSYVGNCLEYEGEYFELNNNYGKAIEKYVEAIDYYKYFSFQRVNLMNKLANCYYLAGSFKKSLYLIDEIILLSKEKDIQYEEEKAIELKLKVLNASSNYNQLEEATCDLVEMKNKRHSLQISELISGLESKNLIYKKQKEIELKEKEILAEKNNKYRLVLFGIILILLLGFLAAYFISRKVYLEKQMVIANQKESIANQKESSAKSDLEHKKRELAAVSTQIVQENEKMTSILKDIKYYVSLINSEKDKTIFSPLLKKLNRLLNDKRKDDNYSEQFSAAYPGFLEFLTRCFPKLTPSDLKLCTFLRMNLNTKEVAEIMALSVRSIESKRYRLRKKFGLTNQDDLVSFLISLEY